MILIVTLGLTVLITVALIYGSRRWESATKQMHAELEAARRPIGRKTYSPDELIGLPAPVQDFRAVLKDGQPIVSAASVEHSGTFNMSETLVNLRGTPEIAQGELMRFLAEAAWYPTALPPSQGVQWKAIDDFSAKGNFEGRRNRTDIAVSLR